MSNKTESLIRDLATLFVKYRMVDWKPVISELEERGGSPALAEAIRRQVERAYSTTAAKKKAKSKAGPKRVVVVTPPELELEPRFSGPNALTIDELRDAMISKRSFPAMSDLKAANTALGIKGPSTSRRDVLVTTLTEYLDGLEPEAFEKALRILAREEERNQSGTIPAYDRWFDLITSGRKSAR